MNFKQCDIGMEKIVTVNGVGWNAVTDLSVDYSHESLTMVTMKFAVAQDGVRVQGRNIDITTFLNETKQGEVIK